MLLKRIFKRLYYNYLLKKNPILYATKMGVIIGKDTRIMGARHGMFSTEPYLISIGENCLITGEVQFITHDGSVYHLKRKIPNVDLIGDIRVGNNVFIGFRAVLLPGTVIGDNVVIGAGAVVKGSIPSNTVAVGVPAKVVSTLDDYLVKIEPKTTRTGGLSMDKKKEILMALFEL